MFSNYKKFKKAGFPVYVLMTVMLISITLPLFYFSYAARDINNTKKVLQEAAYTGALAASAAIDISAFENGNIFAGYPKDNETGLPVAYINESIARYDAEIAVKEYLRLAMNMDTNPNKNDNAPIYTMSDFTIKIDFSAKDMSVSTGRNNFVTVNVILKEYQPLMSRDLVLNALTSDGKLSLMGTSSAKSKSIL